MKSSSFETWSQGRGAEDYWSEDYDQSQNCARGERIAELRAKVHILLFNDNDKDNDYDQSQNCVGGQRIVKLRAKVDIPLFNHYTAAPCSWANFLLSAQS